MLIEPFIMKRKTPSIFIFQSIGVLYPLCEVTKPVPCILMYPSNTIRKDQEETSNWNLFSLEGRIQNLLSGIWVQRFVYGGKIHD